MDFKKRYLSSMVALGIFAVVATNTFADAPPVAADRDDVYGDRLINLPMDESTVNSKSVDVYYLQIPGAHGYTVDLVGSGASPAEDACGAGEVGGNPNDLVHNFQAIIQPSGADCGGATTGTHPGDGNAAGGFFAGPLHLCKYTLPELPDGNYALAINPLMIGAQPAGNLLNNDDSHQEQRRRTNCRGTGPGVAGDDDGNVLNIEGAGFGGYLANALAVGGTNEDDSNYQLFTVADATAPATVAPSQPDLQFPLWDSQFTGAVPVFMFEDESGNGGQASWYQLWIFDENGNRVLDFDHNPTGNGWFNVSVDTGEITCVIQNAEGDRVCTIQAFSSPTLSALMGAGHSANEKWTWWVRGWNSNGMGPWSGMGQFIGNP